MGSIQSGYYVYFQGENPRLIRMWKLWLTISELSQNHCMVEAGRYLWRASGPTPMLKQGHLERVAQDHVQTACQLSPRKKTPQPLWALCQCSVTLTVEKVFLMLKGNLLCCCVLPLVLSLGSSEKTLDPSCLHPPFRYLDTLMRCPLSRLFTRLNSPSSFNLPS